ncbi:MAG: TOBE domain-containing protein [Beijerinckiaceae bacterium]
MHAGAIVQSGTPKELYCNPSSLFAARFFCDFNEIEGTACAGLVETPLGRLQPLNDIADGPCLVCIRPQSLAISPAAANSANAIVKETRFLGEATQVVLSVNGTDYRLRARAAPDFDAKSETAMRISVDPAGVFAYPLPSGRDAPHT